MTLDPASEPGQGARPGPLLDDHLNGPLARAEGAVNCDLMARRLSRTNLLALREEMTAALRLIALALGEREQ